MRSREAQSGARLTRAPLCASKGFKFVDQRPLIRHSSALFLAPLPRSIPDQ